MIGHLVWIIVSGVDGNGDDDDGDDGDDSDDAAAADGDGSDDDGKSDDGGGDESYHLVNAYMYMDLSILDVVWLLA